MTSETLNLDSVKNDKVLLNQKLKSTIKEALVKKFLQGQERPCDKSDFVETKISLEKFSLEIKQLVENSVNDHFSSKHGEESETGQNYTEIDNEALTLLLILCGQNNSPQHWNTQSTVNNCQNVFSQILKLSNCKDSSELFLRNHKFNLVKNILQTLCADLTASTWKYFPASVVCYKWILEMIMQPELSQYLDLVLPPALLLTDDFVTENRIIGVQCLNHIINNITIAELQLYGHGEVIYSALIPILRLREAELVECTILPLVSLTTKLEFDLGKKQPTKWSKFDDILEIYLENMELEQLIDLRKCYIVNLYTLISKVGFNIVRWTKRLLRIFDEYIQTAGKYNDEATIYHCLKVIEKYIELTKEARFLYAKQLLCTLQIALYSISSSNDDTQNESLKIVIGSIKELLESFTDIEKEEFKKSFISDFSENSDCKKFYNQMYEILKNNE